MRYVLILSIILSLADKTIASPARAGLLEIRSMPASSRKPILRWWERFELQIVENPIPTMLIGASSIVLPSLIYPEIGGGAITVLMLVATLKIVTDPFRGESSASKLRGKHVHYNEQHDGTEMLCRGCVLQASPYESKVSVATTDGKESLVPIDDIIGISIPDHPNLHKRVTLVTGADDPDFLRLTGKVSRVYDDGSYEIEVDHKIDYDLNEFPVDDLHTIFVHASLPKHEGGFVFIEGRASEHHEAIQLAASAQRTDVAQTDVDSEHSVVMRSN